MNMSCRSSTVSIILLVLIELLSAGAVISSSFLITVQSSLRTATQSRSLDQHCRCRPCCALPSRSLKSSLDRVPMVPRGGGRSLSFGKNNWDHHLSTVTMSIVAFYALLCLIFPLQQMEVWGLIEPYAPRADRNGTIIEDVDPCVLSLWKKASLNMLYTACFPLFALHLLRERHGHVSSFIFYWFVFGLVTPTLAGKSPVRGYGPQTASMMAAKTLWKIQINAISNFVWISFFGWIMQIVSDGLPSGYEDFVQHIHTSTTACTFASWAVHGYLVIPSLAQVGNYKSVCNLIILIPGFLLVSFICVRTFFSRTMVAMIMGFSLAFALIPLDPTTDPFLDLSVADGDIFINYFLSRFFACKQVSSNL